MDSNCCHSNVELEQYTFTWTIENFPHQGQKPCDLLKSPKFAYPGSKHEWMLRLYPCGINVEREGRIGLYVDLKVAPRDTTFAKFTITYGNSINATAVSTEHYEHSFILGDKYWFLTKILPKKKILDHLEDDGILRLEISLVYAAGTVSRTDYVSSRDLQLKSETKFVDDFASMFDDKRFCDVSINVRGTNILVHLFVLAARSPVFAAMFEHDTQERRAHHVDILDFDYDTVDSFLRYLYSGKLPNFKYDLGLSLLQIGDKYGVEDLKLRCGLYLASTLNSSNVLDVLQLADAHSVPLLKESALDYICANKNVFGNQEKLLPISQSPKLLMDILTKMATCKPVPSGLPGVDV